jgi:tRNA U34 2-thiouridine synthase MnmA/TrmU
MYIIKSDKKSTFKNAIDILDEMSICAIPPGHYAEVEMTATEELLIQKTEEANGIQ